MTKIPQESLEALHTGKSWHDMSAREKAKLDCMVFGTGVLYVADDGTETYIPCKEFFELAFGHGRG